MADSRRRVQDFPGGPEVKNLPANAGDTVRSLVQENPTFHGAIEPALHSERLVSCSWRVASTLHNWRKPTLSHEDLAQPKIKIYIIKKNKKESTE